MATRVSAASTMLLGRRRAAAIPLRIALTAVRSGNVKSTSDLSEIFGANISKVTPAWTSNSRRRGELEASNRVERTRRDATRLRRRCWRTHRTLNRRRRSVERLLQFLKIFRDVELGRAGRVFFYGHDGGRDLVVADGDDSLERQSGEIGVVGHTHVARFPRAGDRRLHLFQDVGRVRIFGCDPK